MLIGQRIRQLREQKAGPAVHIQQRATHRLFEAGQRRLNHSGRMPACKGCFIPHSPAIEYVSGEPLCSFTVHRLSLPRQARAR